MYNFPYLNDSTFLKQFNELKIKQQYVKITVLTWEEEPITNIEGRVISGNINLDGSSGMRRTGTISLVTNDETNDLTTIQNLLSINKKIEVLIGFKNITNEYTEYPIIWFPQGIFVIISPSITHDSNGINISLTIHDKMALLNGECGGVIPASVVFNEIENDDGTIEQPTIYQIIQELVNHFGGEQISKIFINDIDNKAKQVMRWCGSGPLYHYKNSNQNEFTTQYKGTAYHTYSFGDDVGYILTDFTYPGELIGNIGDTVVTILDQIKNTLGNYEYFYDINGNFIFQEIKNYLNTSYSTIVLTIEDEENPQNNINTFNLDYNSNYTNEKSVYTFDNANIIQSYSNAPQYQQIKNDFLVWGKRTTIDDISLPIRYHLAIDEKPVTFSSHSNIAFYEDEDGIQRAKKVSSGGDEITAQDFRTELYLQGIEAQPSAIYSNYYFTELKNEWPKIYDVQHGYFRQQMIANPGNMDYYLDFIDAPGLLSELSIKNIGRRTQTIVDDTINCIFEPTHSNLIIIEAGRGSATQQEAQDCSDRGLDYVQVPTSIYSLLNTGGIPKSAYEQIRKELYQYTSYNEQISLVTVPIYYLEPNTRITVNDPASGIYGDYMIKTISIPLDINGTMSISCTRALERI